MQGTPLATTVNLSGQITARSSAVVSVLSLRGQVTTRSFARVNRFGGLIGSIVTVSSARGRNVSFYGQVTTRASARVNRPWGLVGTITSRSMARAPALALLVGRIAATSQARARVLTLYGQIAAASQAAVRNPTLRGAITATSAARVRSVGFGTARITAAAMGRAPSIGGRLTLAIGGTAKATASMRVPMGGRLTLSVGGTIKTTLQARVPSIGGTLTLHTGGTAKTTSSARLLRFGVYGLYGTIKTTASIAGGQWPQPMRGTIKATSSGRLARPWGLVGTIKTTSSATFTRDIPVNRVYPLHGCIYSQSSGWFYGPNRFLVGQITTRSSGRTLRAGEGLVGRIKTTSTTLSSLSVQSRLSGQITTRAWAGFTPSSAIFVGTVNTISSGRVSNLPLLPTEPPPVCTIDVVLADYLDLITSEHVFKPNYVATMTMSVQPYVDDQILVSGMPCLFDIDQAHGEQLDFTGQWIGKSRYVNLGDVFFSWDTPGLGWDQANWRGAFDPPNALATLDDDHYRLLLYAAIAANHWDGSVHSAYTSWDTLFAGTGYEVMIQDYGNMTMAMALRNTGGQVIDAVTQALFTNGEMDLKPEGVELVDYFFQAQGGVPFFAWDSATDSAAGWDIGYWGVQVAPGEGYVPSKTEGEPEE